MAAWGFEQHLPLGRSRIVEDFEARLVETVEPFTRFIAQLELAVGPRTYVEALLEATVDTKSL